MPLPMLKHLPPSFGWPSTALFVVAFAICVVRGNWMALMLLVFWTLEHLTVLRLHERLREKR